MEENGGIKSVNKILDLLCYTLFTKTKNKKTKCQIFFFYKTQPTGQWPAVPVRFNRCGVNSDQSHDTPHCTSSVHRAVLWMV